MKNGLKKASAVMMPLLLMQLVGCASTSEQLRAQPSATGSFVVSHSLSVVVLNFVNAANANSATGESAEVTKFVPGVSANVEDSAGGLVSNVLYTVDFRAAGDSTQITYYLAGGIKMLGSGYTRADMIDFANGRVPPPPL